MSTMIMVFYGLAEGHKNKNAAGVWRPAAIGLMKILSQPQVRADRAKPIKEILAAGCVVCLLAVHETKIAAWSSQSSWRLAPAGNVADEITLFWLIYDIGFTIYESLPNSPACVNRISKIGNIKITR
ncbi:MAG: hypothetical protein WAO02_02335 [Verrucomicrobiia bacterium]